MGTAMTAVTGETEVMHLDQRRVSPLGESADNQLILGDCIQQMALLPSQSFDLAIADPPYNLSKGGSWSWDSKNRLPRFGGDWQKVMQTWDNMPLAEYFHFTTRWLAELKRLVRPTGSIWVHGTYHNVGIMNVAMQLIGIEIINEVVWYKRNSFPNLSGRRLTASHETILWAHTGDARKRKYLFNYAASKELACPADLLKEAGKQLRTVWDIPNNKTSNELQHGKHPTQKPLRLIQRMISISGKRGGKCLVPFAGSGTECVAAIDAGLSFVAFESDASYFDIARQRIAAAKQTPDLLFANA